MDELAFPDNPNEQDRNHCIIIRGDGWQIDTFPIPSVQTLVWHDGDGRPSYEGCLSGDQQVTRVKEDRNAYNPQ